ncbi:MAG: cation transporter [Thiotrichaceae bacterium]|nr:cation transporter [Thiotrichaceae bacterium]
MNHKIEVENIRCGGCANTISKKLLAIHGLEAVDINIEDQIVSVECIDDALPIAIKTLAQLGYPEKGSVEGLEALKGKAKSIVSCAIGKVGS